MDSHDHADVAASQSPTSSGNNMRGVYDLGGSGGGSPSAIATSRPIYYGPQRPQPQVVLVSLEKQPFFDEMFSTLLTALRSKATVHEVTTLPEAKSALDSPTNTTKPTAVLFTDGAITTNRDLLALAHRYLRSSAGTVVMMGHFPSFTTPSKIKTLFSTFGLPWQCGDYHRTTFSLNSSVAQKVSSRAPASLAKSSSQKALHLKNVARADALYLPTPRSRIESHVFAPEPISDLCQTPVAFAEVGRGKVGYIGDVNAETEMNLVVLAMCGLA